MGKSQATFQCCVELGKKYDTTFGMIEVRGASSSPAELAAIKYVSDGQVEEAEQAWVPTNEKVKAGLCPERGIIFCDEISSSLPAVQSTLQRLFLDRKLGGLSVADGWYVMAAGNRAKDKSAAGNLSRAFQNRCMMITVEPDPDVFFDWGVENGVDSSILAYVRFKPSCVQDGNDPKRGENQSFCSPRSLEIASDLVKGGAHLPDATRLEALSGILGEGVGTEFGGFLRIMNDLPDIDKILKDPENYKVPEKIDVTWATIGALNHRANKKNVGALMKFFVRLSTELSVVAIKDLAKIEHSTFNTPEFSAWAHDNIQLAM